MNKHDVILRSALAERSLAVAHGFMTPTRGAYLIAFSEGDDGNIIDHQNLPEGGVMLEIGAGRSTLGESLGYLRKDVQLISLDIQYGEKAAQLGSRVLMHDHHSRMAAGSLNVPLRDASVDAVVAHQIFNHVTRLNPLMAEAMLHEVGRVLKPSGLLWVGPNPGLTEPEERNRLAITPQPELADSNAYRVATFAPDAGMTRIYQASQKSGIGIFDGGRFDASREGQRMISVPPHDPMEAERYVPLKSPQGIVQAFRLGVQFLKV